MKIEWLPVVAVIELLLAAAPLTAQTPPLDLALLSHSSDHGFMWWPHGWRGRSPDGRRVFCIQTGSYGMAFDVDHATLTHLGLIDPPLPALQGVAACNEIVFGLPPVRLITALNLGDRSFRAVSAAPKVDQARIVEHGRFVQRVELLEVQFKDADGGALPAGMTARYEFVAWPDRLALLLHVTTEKEGQLIAGSMSLEWPDPEWCLVQQGPLCLMSGPKDTSGGLAIMGTPGTRARVRGAAISSEMQGRWLDPRKTLTLGLLISPFRDKDDASAVQRLPDEQDPQDDVTVCAKGITPYVHPLESRFDPLDGCYKVRLGNHAADGWKPALDPQRMERIAFTLSNPRPSPRIVRLAFIKESPSGMEGITGLTPMIRDVEGNPTGLPVQISKNWHEHLDWLSASTLVTLPPESTVPLEFTIAYAFWGGVPAISHAQLCLIGWGVNQLWHEVAIGSFGESICYDPDVNLNRAMIDDMRPLMCTPMGRGPRGVWNWTNNVGGADFLVLIAPDGQRQYLSHMRTFYTRYGPNLAEVTYAGQTPDGAIDARMTVLHTRSDDLTRGIYRIRYDVRRPVPFQRLAFFQLGADLYNDHQFKRIARGNEEGMLEEWSPVTEGSGYDRTGITCPGRLPWFSLHESVKNPRQSGAWANRGLIVRRWQARLGGQNVPSPAAGTWRTRDRVPSVTLELMPPSELRELSESDYVEAELELLVMPVSAEDYIGLNDGLRKALAVDGNTWRMVWREATGNDLRITARSGSVEANYPVHIRCDAGGEARFQIEGGLGYIPITLSGVKSQRGWRLEQDLSGTWRSVDQSVHGNDFWQAEYHPDRRAWDLTFNIPADLDRRPLQLRLRGREVAAESKQ